MSADEATVFKRCNVPEKVIKSTMKKDTTRNALYSHLRRLVCFKSKSMYVLINY